MFVLLADSQNFEFNVCTVLVYPSLFVHYHRGNACRTCYYILYPDLETPSPHISPPLPSTRQRRLAMYEHFGSITPR